MSARVGAVRRAAEVGQVFRGIIREVKIRRMGRARDVQAVRGALGAWREVAGKKARGRRVAAAAAAHLGLAGARRALSKWVAAGAARRARLQAEDMSRMEVSTGH